MKAEAPEAISERSAGSAGRTRHPLERAFLWGVLPGTAVRLSFALATDFPRLDGGLFYVMMSELQANDFRLPEFTAYNGTGIPFAYPPLALYVTAFLGEVTGIDLLDLERVQPAVVASLALVAFAALAWQLTRNRAATALATAVYALASAESAWLFIGGGITRSAGTLLAFLLLHRLIRMYRERRRRDVALAALLAGALVTAHTDWALFGFYSSVLLLLFLGRDRWGLGASAAVAAGALVVAFPWLFVLARTHGLDVLLAPVQENSSPSGAFRGLQFFLSLDWTAEKYPIVLASAVAGVIILARRREYLLPAWIAAACVLQPRGTIQVVAPVAAIAAGVGLAAFESWLSGEDARASTATRRVAAVAIALLILAGASMRVMDVVRTFRPLTPAEREAMAWLRSNTPEEASVLVLTEEFWGLSPQQEWLPALAERTSVNTVQGHEWLPGFRRRIRANDAGRWCTERGPSCLAEWRRSWSPFGYVYLQREPPGVPSRFFDACCERLIRQLRLDPGYRLVYENADAAIFEVRASTSTRP